MMRIESIRIKGFRNFVDETVLLSDKTLIIGGNDVGKSNLLHALRLLIDPTLSSSDLELSSGDFNIQSNAELVQITARITDVSEDCLISAFAGALKDGAVCIRYSCKRDGDFEFATGPDENNLTPCQNRYYIRQLSMEYVKSNRDLSSFLKRQQSHLVGVSRANRSDREIEDDQKALENIQSQLNDLNDEITDLHYISESMEAVNREMERLSANNEGYNARFVAGNTDAGKLLDNLHLAYMAGGSPLIFGGEGRSNQLYFATWISSQRIQRTKEKVIVFAIEEPEAHLHPHQQRKLAEYLTSELDEQVLVTTHSPQIVERFTEGKIVRLSQPDNKSGTISFGCTSNVDDALNAFGYRLNQVSAEVFFSSGVLLVEGPSEAIFYKAFSRELGVDLNRLNLSVLSVDGIGFAPFARVCSALGIPYTVRTDNDIFKVPGKDERRYAGVERAIDICKLSKGYSDIRADIEELAPKLHWFGSSPSSENQAAARTATTLLEKVGIFLSVSDLEMDLAESPIEPQLQAHYSLQNREELVRAMKRRKAENMRSFIQAKPDLQLLEEDDIAKPLRYLVDLLAERLSGNGAE